MTDSIDGIDRSHSRYRQPTILKALTRHKPPETTTPMPTTNREAPDRSQVIGIPLFIQRTPPWNRQDWAQHDQLRHPIFGL
jgi:hypothetical protein